MSTLRTGTLSQWGMIENGAEYIPRGKGAKILSHLLCHWVRTALGDENAHLSSCCVGAKLALEAREKPQVRRGAGGSKKSSSMY